jgi:hypothetical protein
MLAAALIGQGNNEAPVPCQPAPQANFRITDFSRLNPPKFSGSEDPIEANDWLREIEMKLDVVHADNWDKVLLAVQQLKGPALAWWHSYHENNAEGHHVPDSLVRIKQEEFMHLKQGNMSVVEYLHKFTELSRYEPDAVKTDEKKQGAFLRGLSTDIKSLVGSSKHANFNDMVNIAITTEKHRNEEMQERKRKFEGRKQCSQGKF